jgi:hypothetical protein
MSTTKIRKWQIESQAAKTVVGKGTGAGSPVALTLGVGLDVVGTVLVSTSAWRAPIGAKGIETDAGTNIVGAATYTLDGVALTNGMRILLTGETVAAATYEDKVFVVSGVGTAIVLTAPADGQLGDGSTNEGDIVYVLNGTANNSLNFYYDGTSWSQATAAAATTSWRVPVDATGTETNAGTNIVGQASYTLDGHALVNGDRILLTGETTAAATYEDKVFLVSGVGTAIVLVLESDGLAGTGAPSEGDMTYVIDGTANGNQTWKYEGGAWVTTAVDYIVPNETPTGAVDSSNTVFTTANVYSSGSLRVYLNGLRQQFTVDYTETTSTTFTFTTAPDTGDVVTVDYGVSASNAPSSGSTSKSKLVWTWTNFQANVSGSFVLPYNNLLCQVGTNITLNTGTGFITLAANSKYLIEPQVDADASWDFQLYENILIVSWTQTTFNESQGNVARYSTAGAGIPTPNVTFIETDSLPTVIKVSYFKVSWTSVMLWGQSFGTLVKVTEL